MLIAAVLMPFASQAQSKSVHHVILDTTVCDSYTWPANGVTYNYSTAATHYSPNRDTLYVLDLTVNRTIVNTITTPIHGGCTFTWNGTTYTHSGTYCDTMQTVGHCDSIVTLTVQLSDTAYNTYNVTACSTYTWKGTTYTASTHQTRNEQTADCDSVLTLNLSINTPTAVEHYDTVTACNKTYYRFVTGTQPTEITRSFDTARTFPLYTNGLCVDSTSHIRFQINKSSYNSLTKDTCDKYVLIIDSARSKTYIRTTIDTILVGKNVDVCDSFVVLNLTINASPKPHIGGDIDVRPGETANLTVTCDQENVNYRWSTGSTEDHITIPNVAQNQDVSVTATNRSTGCAGETHVTVTANVGIDNSANAEFNIYPNPASNYVNIVCSETVQQIAVYNMAGQRVAFSNEAGVNSIDLGSLTNGSYIINVTLQSGKQLSNTVVVAR